MLLWASKKNDNFLSRRRKEATPGFVRLIILVNQLFKKGFLTGKNECLTKSSGRSHVHIPWQNYHQLTTWLSASFCFLYIFFIPKYCLKNALFSQHPIATVRCKNTGFWKWTQDPATESITASLEAEEVVAASCNPLLKFKLAMRVGQTGPGLNTTLPDVYSPQWCL